MTPLVETLVQNKTLTEQEFLYLLNNFNEETLTFLMQKAREVATQQFGNNIYIRGLIEVSNYCKNNCYYCGIREGNHAVQRYRLTKEDILSCCSQGYKLGFRTFVLQGGEDPHYSDAFITDVVQEIRTTYPDCAITLSLGEKSIKAYEQFYNAGANRYLLRHETVTQKHYIKLHPKTMSLEYRLQCLNDLKAIGFQVGTGIMVGSPYQTMEDIARDIKFIEKFKPQMIGIGPFIPHKDTPLKNFNSGSLHLTLLLLAIFRIMHPKALIPSTTALSSIHPQGRENGILAGANVVMPNLSPIGNRKNYALYNNKAALGAESAQGLLLLNERLLKIGYKISYQRGDYK